MENASKYRSFASETDSKQYRIRKQGRVSVSGYYQDIPAAITKPDNNMDYYENNARAFIESTIQIDMQPLYQRFLPLLPERAHILDVGCGSGRDAKFFIQHGYHVTAFDSSINIAAMAEKEIGQSVQVQRAQDMQFENEFDGIWACASLLHVPAKELPDVFHRLACALKSAGVIYCSFKYGQGEYESQGRRFTDLNKAGLRALMEEIKVLTIRELWITSDRRPARQGEQWLNAVLAVTETNERQTNFPNKCTHQ